MKKKVKVFNGEIDLIVIIFGLFIIVTLFAFLFCYFYFFNDEGVETNKIWNIKLGRVINSYCSNDTECTTPYIYTDSTTIGDYTVEFLKSTGSAKYELTVDNDGYVDAELTSIVLSTPVCKGNASNETVAINDGNNVCNNIKYRLVDENDNSITLGNKVEAKSTKTYYLFLEYNDVNYDGVHEIISDSVTVSNLAISLNYRQSE